MKVLFIFFLFFLFIYFLFFLFIFLFICVFIYFFLSIFEFTSHQKGRQSLKFWNLYFRKVVKLETSKSKLLRTVKRNLAVEAVYRIRFNFTQIRILESVSMKNYIFLIDFFGEFPWFWFIICYPDPNPGDRNETDPNGPRSETLRRRMGTSPVLSFSLLALFTLAYLATLTTASKHLSEKKIYNTVFVKKIQLFTTTLQGKYGILLYREESQDRFGLQELLVSRLKLSFFNDLFIIFCIFSI